ncbi:hypothetical protein ACFQWH_09325 [Mycolicibacterium sp. GCM10028919]|uniref:hypothetical protein n=1 Tax=Mycolicibacterium sp. GCM10028919 TaxID=3273401 RepID=UPI003609E767
MFEGPSSRREDEVPLERRLDGFADLAKESTQLAGKLRTNLNSVATGAKLGVVANAHAQLTRAKSNVTELATLIDRLELAEQTLGLRGAEARPSHLADELDQELAKRGVEVVRGPAPYRLAYPAWFKVERTPKGVVDVVLNGERLDSLRPSAAADEIAEAVSEKFKAEQFTELLLNVRQLLRRAGAPGSALALNDIYEILVMEPGRGAPRRKEFSRGAFYYSVHRLAEDLDTKPDAIVDFPNADRSEAIFFDRRGNSRKYLTVNFTDGLAR